MSIITRTYKWPIVSSFILISALEIEGAARKAEDLTARERQKIQKMAEPDKLNIDSIIQRLLEGEEDQTRCVDYATKLHCGIYLDDGLHFYFLHLTWRLKLMLAKFKCNSPIKIASLKHSVVGFGQKNAGKSIIALFGLLIYTN